MCLFSFRKLFFTLSMHIPTNHNYAMEGSRVGITGSVVNVDVHGE